MELSFDPVFERIPLLLRGLGLTGALASLAFVMGTLGGLPLALGRMSSVFRSVITGMIEATLSTPVPLQLLLVFFGLASTFDLFFTPFQAVLIVLTWNQAVVMAENYRAGIQSVPEGYKRAGIVLGLSRTDRYRFIILPLAIRAVLPPMTSSTVNIIKDSALAGFIGATDLLNAGLIGATESFRPIEFYTVVAIVYFMISYPVVLLSDRLENAMAISRDR